MASPRGVGLLLMAVMDVMGMSVGSLLISMATLSIPQLSSVISCSPYALKSMEMLFSLWKKVKEKS